MSIEEKHWQTAWQNRSLVYGAVKRAGVSRQDPDYEDLIQWSYAIRRDAGQRTGSIDWLDFSKNKMDQHRLFAQTRSNLAQLR